MHLRLGLCRDVSPVVDMDLPRGFLADRHVGGIASHRRAFGPVDVGTVGGKVLGPTAIKIIEVVLKSAIKKGLFSAYPETSVVIQLLLRPLRIFGRRRISARIEILPERNSGYFRPVGEKS